jgi:type I restriction enzyme S subunit
MTSEPGDASFRYDLPAGWLHGSWLGKTIMPSNLKKRVHARMARTGETYQAALRQLRAQERSGTTSATMLGAEASEMSAQPPTLFSTGVEACDAYRACRDHSTKEDIKARYERAFRMHGHLCPEGAQQFVSELRRDFYSRAWELYLMAVLHDAGVTLEAPSPHGPDILVRLGSSQRCWIEAVVPKAGTGEDKVFERPDGPWAGSHGPVDKLLVRYRSALEDKLRKVDVYVRQGIIAPTDAVIIAVSGWGIRDAWTWDVEFPALVKAVYPVGDPVLVVPIDSPEPERVEVPPRWVVHKTRGAPVCTDFFLEPRTAQISAVLYVRSDAWNASWDPARALGIIHNMGASVPVKRGSLPARVEWWVQDNQLHQSDRPPTQEIGR